MTPLKYTLKLLLTRILLISLPLFFLSGCDFANNESQSPNPAPVSDSLETSPEEKTEEVKPEPSLVQVHEGPEGYQLLVDGEPFLIKGAGGIQYLDQVKAAGGNAIRTWGINEGTSQLLDEAHALGLKVALGIWLGHKRHGFDYSDEARVRKQFERVRDTVIRYKDHPALLLWGLGNEMEGFAKDTNPLVWQHIEDLAKMVKAEDPNHPTMTVISGTRSNRIASLKKYCPSIDILGINAYAEATHVYDHLKSNHWEKPFILAEFGSIGHWQSKQTSWAASIEPNSSDKAADYFTNWKIAIEDKQDTCLGGFIFLWGQKQETTSTWYGMFLKDGTRLPPVDAMTRAWSGEWPENRCPKLSHLACEVAYQYVKPGQTFTATVTVEDPENDPLTYQWIVTGDILKRRGGGDREPEPPIYDDSILNNEGKSVTIQAPEKPGPYRVFIYTYDGQGNAATANVPFYVKGS